MTIAELRALLAKATPGPFYEDVAISDDGYVVMSQEAGVRMAHFPETLNTRRFLNQGANAALVAEALNALPALLDVAEASKRVRQCRHNDQYGGPCSECMRPLVVAVDKLEP